MEHNKLNPMMFKVIFNPKSRVLKVLSLFLAFTLLGEVVFPTVVMAMITNGASQPDVFNYQPVDATDNVSLTTGAFNYTIPMTSIPEYPMAISYRSGIKPGQEAGVFGLGFYGFSGAIGRSMMGLPDDMRGAIRTYHYENQKKWSASAGATIGVGKKFKVPVLDSLGIGGSVTVSGGYDNYTGAFGSIGLGLSISKMFTEEDAFFSSGIGAGLGITSDSRNSRATFGTSLGIFYGINISKLTGWKKPFVLSESLASAGFSQQIGDRSSRVSAASTLLSAGITNFSPAAGNSAQSLAPLSNVLPYYKGWGISLSVPLPLAGAVSVTVNASYNQSKLDNNNLQKKVFGYQYLCDLDRRDNSHLGDFTIEGETAFPGSDAIKKTGHDPRVNPSYLQRDYFMANAMGFGGAMQLQQQEYGVVSRGRTRTQYRDIGVLKIKTSRKEAFPWATIDQPKFNNAVDILKLMKGGDADTDFDAVIFKQHEKVSLTRAEHTFGKTKFKMRGDMAGEFDLASKDFRDHEPNDFMLQKVKGTGGYVVGFMRGGRKITLYEPKPADRTASMFNGAGDIQRSTDIKHTTLDEILGAYDKWKETDPELFEADNFKLQQSFYTHNTYKKAGGAKTANVVLNDHLSAFSILNHLKEIKENSGSDMGSVIGAIEVRNVSGLKYIFNLPAFAKGTETLMLRGKGKNAPVKSGDDYNSFGGKQRNKVTIKDEYAYPYAWMLTAIVGEDYIDFDDVPGPSDGDIGYWVKFKYTKTSDDYRWRYPFTGLAYVPNGNDSYGDDSYNMTTGLKEIYVLSEIESSQYVCRYNYQKRFDGLDAAHRANGNARNPMVEGELDAPAYYSKYKEDPTGSNFQFVVTGIDLFKKHPEGEHSGVKYDEEPGKKVKSTRFEYDYSLSSKVPNNLATYTTVNQGGLDYYYNPEQGKKIGTGCLTLRKIQHIAYDSDGNEEYLPSYNFSYYGDKKGEEKYNPEYNGEMRDSWGNYNAGAATPSLPVSPSNSNTYTRLYSPYCEYDPDRADENARAWELKQIGLPSGGKMDVEYQAQSYAYVEDKPAYNMRRLPSGTEGAIEKLSKTTRVLVDADDICREEIAATGSTSNLRGLKKVMEPGDKLYGEICFFQSRDKEPGRLFVASTEVNLVDISDDLRKIDGRYYQAVEVEAAPDDDDPHKAGKAPFYHEIELFMYGESEQATCVRQSMPMSCSNVEKQLKEMDNMGKAKPLVAAKRAIANFRNIFSGNGRFKSVLDDCMGVPGTYYIPEMSFIRTPVYKAKYTGTRVKTIKYDDQFHYATALDGGVTDHSSVYGSEYFFDENSDGTGKSAGVATIEPVGGKSAAIDINELVGMGYLPSPAIISSRTTLCGLYNDEDAGDNIQSRKKGKTVYEFYTPKDKSLNYTPTSAIKTKSCIGSPMNAKGEFIQWGMIVYFLIKIKIFGHRIKIWIPIPLPISIHWKQKHDYHMQSYSYLDYTDIFGRPKSVTQLNAGGMEEGTQEFEYYGVDEAVPVYKGGFGSSDKKMMRPGKVDQAWSEAWYSKETDLSLIPWLLHFEARTRQHRNFINMKYSYVPPVMKEVITSVDGQKTITKNTGFDYYTGTPVEVRSEDSYGNEKIKRTVPAYWKYPEMGPVDKNDGNLNKLTGKTGSYLYLNKTDDAHLLGASVTKWNKSDFDIVDYLQPEREKQDDDTYRYVYNEVTGNEIKQAYSSAKSRSDRYIKRNACLYKPVETYTYETDLNGDGTFAAFTGFNYGGFVTNGKAWKMVSKSERFDANGVLVQASDILQKKVSQQMGYNFSKAVSVVANAPYNAAFYDGAENSYEVNGHTVLESGRVKMGDATIFNGNCEPEYEQRNLFSADYLKGEKAKSLSLLQVTRPSVFTAGQTFGQLNVTFGNGIQRVLFLSMDAQQRYRMTSNFGEDFSGFVLLPSGNPGKDLLLFDLDQVSSLTVATTGDSHGFKTEKVTRDLSGPYESCTDFPVKPYQLPANDCMGDVHTGHYAFSLEGGGKTGTFIELNKQELGEKEYARRYKAMVWVLNASPAATEMVIRRTDVNDNVTEEVVPIDEPYARTGNWILLRRDFDLKTPDGAETKKTEVFMRNNSSNGLAIYDDIRVLPFHAEMSNYVYDPAFDRVTSTLDADNFATFSEYDKRGRVIRNGVEIDGVGQKTVKQMLYHDQK